MAIINLKVPDIGNFDSVDVIEVLIKVGDIINIDQNILTLESDKASMDVPSDQAGKVVELLVNVGDKIKEGDVIAKIETEGAVAQATEIKADEKITTQDAKPSTLVEPIKKSEPVVAPVVNTTPSEIADFSKVHASPSVRAFARELGVDLNQVKGTGPSARILQEDVSLFVKGILTGNTSIQSKSSNNTDSGLNLLPWPKVNFEKFGTIEKKPLSRIKKISGANLTRNWVMIPHVTQFDETDVTELEAFRVQLNKEHEKLGKKTSMLPFLVKASVNALQAYPEFNSSLEGDDLILKQYYHIGFAADTPNGLVVPVIRDCDQKGIFEIADEMASLAKLAREGKLKPEQMQGGTFTISSLGGIGGTAFTPIINAPEVAILGVSKTSMKPVWDGKTFNPRLMLPLSLSYDHRVIDGAAGARFITHINKLLTDMRRILI